MPNPNEAPTQQIDRRFSVAPMMEYTDRFCRYFHRLLSKETLLYTEMVTSAALTHGDTHRHLQFAAQEHPIALQLGGSDPAELAAATRLANAYRYDEINLNCGCPSDRVQSGMFGAVLMKNARHVAACFRAMQDATATPVTIKHRVGVDELDSYPFLCEFVGTVAEAGCHTFIVHARKAWLKGLSPKQNREVPPLDYQAVYRLKADFPDLEIILNGGVTTLQQSLQHLQQVDGVMMGREAYHNPYLLAEVDQRLFHRHTPSPSREDVLEKFCRFVEGELSEGVRLGHMTRHILGLYQGVPGARKFRRHISENAHRPGAGTDVLQQALTALNELRV
ncbi:tRNA dihydrouridine(20/20a) synthase DusA [Porticoccus sp.]